MILSQSHSSFPLDYRTPFSGRRKRETMISRMRMKKTLLFAAVIFLASLSASAEPVFAYCKASVGASDTFYFSRVYQFDSKNVVGQSGGSTASHLERDSYSFDKFGAVHWPVKGALTGFCASAHSRTEATDKMNAEAAWFKQTGIKFVFTDWTPAD